MISNLFLILSVLCWTALAETGCPPPEDIKPCTCSHSPSTKLQCTDILDPDTLKEVFKNSERYTFQEVHITNSSLMFLPPQMVEKSTVYELYLENAILNHIFHSPPNGSLLYKLHIENSRFSNQASSLSTLKSLSNLKTLEIHNTLLPVLPSTFSENLPKNLREFTIRSTRTRKIHKGAFSQLTNLDKLVIDSCNLTDISKELFPENFNARFIYLDNNLITKIPEDLFVGLQNLQFLSLKNNLLTELSEAAFGRTHSIPYVRLEGNPLKCNCLLVWLIKDKPEIISGSCSTPKRLNGRKLQELRPVDFNC